MTADGDSDDGAAAEAAATVNIRCSNGSKFSVQTTLGAAVGSLKSAVAAQCEVPAEQQRLIYKGRILKDDHTLASYGVESDHNILLVHGAASTPTNIGASSVPNSNSGVVGLAGSNEVGGIGGEAGSGHSLFPGPGVNGLAGNVASGLFGNPDLDQIRQQLTRNPNMMREMMNTPSVRSLMSDPDLLLNLVTSNPHMREVLDWNPELVHILNDPNTLRQSVEAARSLEIMREMNTNRAMSNIEAPSERFNMLRRMYENVREPFLNATTLAGDARNGFGSNPLASLLGNQGTTQSRDRLPTTADATSRSTVPNTNPLPNPWSNTTAGATQIPYTRSVPTSDTQTPSTAGLGGLGLPESGAIPDPFFLSQATRNPAVSQMMQSRISNPQFWNQQFLPFHQSLLSQIGRQQLSPEQNQTGGATGTPNTSELDHPMNMFGGLGAGTLGIPNSTTSDVPHEELYAIQLSQLREMGFFDTQENIGALIATRGNVHVAVERLLRNLRH